LSQTLYSAEKMDTLFESFEADAHLVLLFLQHLESIELYVREESESDPERTFHVRIADQSLQIVRAKRKEFLSKIKPGKVMTESVTVTYPVIRLKTCLPNRGNITDSCKVKRVTHSADVINKQICPNFQYQFSSRK